MKFRAYIVEDSPTIRENLIETLQELARVDAVGVAETELKASAGWRRTTAPGTWRSSTCSCGRAAA